jgi:hypothetical protein
LDDLAFVGLTPYLRDKLDEQEFSDTKYSRFRDKEKHHVNFVDEEADD